MNYSDNAVVLWQVGRIECYRELLMCSIDRRMVTRAMALELEKMMDIASSGSGTVCQNRWGWWWATEMFVETMAARTERVVVVVVTSPQLPR